MTATLDAPTRARGKLERLAVERHERMLALAGGPDVQGRHPKGYYFDSAAANHAVAFIEEKCRHHKGEWAGRPLLLEPWQKDDILRPMFGWMKPELDARGAVIGYVRLYRIAYVEIPRKNGKTEVGAGVGTLLFIADDEPGAEVYATATKEEQAKILWTAAKEMVKQSPDLADYVDVRRKTLSCAELGSKFEPLGSDSDTLDGLMPHGNLVDEMHAHKDPHLLNVLITGTGARRQPLTFIITTAGVYNPESPGWEQHDYAVKVLEGTQDDDSFFAYVAAIDDEDIARWDQPDVWAKANPNLGVSVKLDYLQQLVVKAKNQPSFYNTFLRYHLNRWVEQETRWISVESWNACDATPIDEDTLAGQVCYGGLDLSSKLDLTAFVLCFPRPGGRYRLVCRFWCPDENIAIRAQKDRAPYLEWKKAGILTPTPGNVVDYDFIEAEVKRLAGKFTIKEIAFDPWGAQQTATRLAGEGLTMVEMRQGFGSLSEPSKELEKLVLSKKIEHGGNPALRWCVGNTAVKEDPAENIKPVKTSQKNRIDGVLASIMALGRAITQPADQGSAYETGDLLVL